MGTLYAIGSDGSCDLPTDFDAQIQTWSASFSRTTQIVTGFGDTGAQRKQSAVIDITGSAGGIPTYDAGSTAPFPLDGDAMDDAAGGSIVLQVVGAVSPIDTASKVTFDCVFSSYDLSSEQDGAASITFNFQLASDTGPTLSWNET